MCSDCTDRIFGAGRIFALWSIKLLHSWSVIGAEPFFVAREFERRPEEYADVRLPDVRTDRNLRLETSAPQRILFLEFWNPKVVVGVVVRFHIDLRQLEFAAVISEPFRFSSVIFINDEFIARPHRRNFPRIA